MSTSMSMSIMHRLSRDVRDLLLKSHHYHLSHSISWTVETVDLVVGDDDDDASHMIMEPLSFVREFVAPARPLLIRNAAPNEWQIQAQPNQLAASLKGAKVQVDIAGGGLADAVVRAPGPDATFVFAQPFVTHMTFEQFHAELNEVALKMKQNNGIAEDTPVPYIQHQDNNLQQDFSQLLDAIPLDGPSWARKAFGEPPEARNFWAGCSASVTSAHRDHYNNVYAVLRGTKTFHLLPPTDAYFVPRKPFPNARWAMEQDGTCVPKLTNDHDVLWIQPDDERRAMEETDDGDECGGKFVTVDVNAGDILYLPPQWLHRVTQRGPSPDDDLCVAVNWWWAGSTTVDMRSAVQNALEGLREL
ncbi:peptidyl-lysine (3S)-dioxygenase / protease [Pycnococcus provasolii]